MSIHQSPLYPGTGPASDVGSGRGEGYTVNLPVPSGSGDQMWCSLVEHVVVPVGREYAPQLVLVSAGFDAHRDDPLASCACTSGGFAVMAASLRRLADELGVPIGLVLEGGYDLAGLARRCARRSRCSPRSARRPSPSSGRTRWRGRGRPARRALARAAALGRRRRRRGQRRRRRGRRRRRLGQRRRRAGLGGGRVRGRRGRRRRRLRGGRRRGRGDRRRVVARELHEGDGQREQGERPRPARAAPAAGASWGSGTSRVRAASPHARHQSCPSATGAAQRGHGGRAGRPGRRRCSRGGLVGPGPRGDRRLLAACRGRCRRPRASFAASRSAVCAAAGSASGAGAGAAGGVAPSATSGRWRARRGWPARRSGRSARRCRAARRSAGTPRRRARAAR